MRENNSLGDKFAGFTSEPDPGVWENIERSLDEKPRRRGFAWWIFLVAGAVAGITAWNVQGGATPEATKQLPGANRIASPAAHSAAPSGNKAGSGVDENRFFTLQGKQQEAGRSLTFTSGTKKQQLVFGRQGGAVLHREEMPYPAGGSLARNASGNIAGEPVVEAAAGTTEEALMAERHASGADSTDKGKGTLPDSTLLSQQDAEAGMKQLRSAGCRWQLQAQIGALVSGREEMMVPPLNEPYYEGTGNVTSGGFLPPGDPGTIKTYRNLTTSYSLLASYNPANRWRFTSGFTYLRYYLYMPDDRSLHAGAHYFQLPLMADFRLISQPKWEWALGTGVSLGYVFDKKQAGQFSSWRSDFIVQTSWRYTLSRRLLIQVQPQARFVLWDKQLGKINKLSPWYGGANAGLIWCF